MTDNNDTTAILNAVAHLANQLRDLDSDMTEGFDGAAARHTKLADEVTELRDEMRAGFARVDQRFAATETVVAALVPAMTQAMHDMLSNFVRAVATQTADEVTSMRAELAALRARIEKLEARHG